MTEREGSRPSLTRWLTEKMEGLATGRKKEPGLQSTAGPTPPPPDPLVKRQAAEIKQLTDKSQRLAKELEDAQVMLMGKEAEFKNDLQELQERNAELLDKIVKLTQRDRELQAKVLDAKFDGTGAKDQVKILDSELRDLRRSHAAKEQQVAELTDQLKVLQEQVSGQPEMDALAAESQELSQRLHESLTQLQDITQEREHLQAQLTDTQAQLAHAQAQLTKLRELKEKHRPVNVAQELPTPEEAPPMVGPPTRVQQQLAIGPDADPLKAMAAGQAPKAARQTAEIEKRYGRTAKQVLESPGREFAPLPEGFAEALVAKPRSRRSTSEHRESRRRSPRGRQRRFRSRRSGTL